MALLDLLKFVTTGLWGSGIARPLTAAEADGNVYNLAEAIQTALDGVASGVELSNITVGSNAVTFYLSDGSTRGPFPLPVTNVVFTGAFITDNLYSVGQIFLFSGMGYFMVMVDHTSDPTTFDPNAYDGGNRLYVQLAEDASVGGSYEPLSFSTQNSSTSLTIDDTYNNYFLDMAGAGDKLVTFPETIGESFKCSFRLEVPGVTCFFSTPTGGTMKGKTGFLFQMSVYGAVVHTRFFNSAWHIWGDLDPAP